MAEEFTCLPEGVNLFPVGSGEKHTQIVTDKPVCMPVCRTGENGTVMRFFNPAKTPDLFHLTVNGTTAEIAMNAYELVSAVYKDGKIGIRHNDIPI